MERTGIFYMIHVCYAVYDRDGRFSKNIGTSMVSIFENTSEWITVHLLHDNTLNEANRTKFIELVRKYGNYIRFYNMDELDLPVMDVIRQHGRKVRYSPAAFYRLLAGEVLSPEIQRLIYLDADVIVNLDIKEFWEYDMAGAPLGAVSEYALTYHNMVPKEIIRDGTVEQSRYFCSGVLLLDLKSFAAKGGLVQKGMDLLSDHPEYTTPDQDILNYFFSSTYCSLPIRYDMFADAERLVGHNQLQPAIYHFAGEAAFDAYRGDVYDRLWAKYYVMTPWFTADSFHDICRAAADNAAGIISSFWRFMRGRTFTVVCDEGDLERLHELLGLQQGDRFLRLYSGPRLINLASIITDMRERLAATNGKKEIYLFFTTYYSKLYPKFIEAGFQEGLDFVDATWMLRTLEQSYPRGYAVWKNI